jgi:hypothetical protein
MAAVALTMAVVFALMARSRPVVSERQRVDGSGTA